MRVVWLAVILAAGAAAYWFHTRPDALGDLKALLPDGISSPGTDRLYKWRNERGEWQMTDTLPPAGTPYETLDFRADVNVLPVPPQLSR